MAIDFQFESLSIHDTDHPVLHLLASGHIKNEDWINSFNSAIEKCEGQLPSAILIDTTNATDLIGLDGFRQIATSISASGVSSLYIALVTTDPLDKHRRAVVENIAKDSGIKLASRLFNDLKYAKHWLAEQIGSE